MLWRRENVDGDPPTPPRYLTQRRCIDTSGKVLGLSGEIPEATAQEIARSLNISGLDHQEARKAFVASPTLKARGSAMGLVLDAIAVEPRVWGRLLFCGYLAGVWGTPFLWDAQISRRVFPGRGTAAMTARAPP